MPSTIINHQTRIMKYIVEKSLSDFDAWSGGKDTKNALTEDQLEQEERFIDEIFLDNIPTETQINEKKKYESDAIAQYLGFSDWEHLNREDEDDDEEDED